MPEEWRDVIGYEGWYQVSSEGRVRRIAPGPHTHVGRILKQRPSRAGYWQVALSVSNRSIHHLVHHLVAYAFLGPRPDSHDINHVDGNPLNNRPRNLEYLSKKDHEHHSRHILGRTYNLVGEALPQSILTAEQVIEIRRLYATGDYLQRELAERFGVKIVAINQVVNGKSWKHVDEPLPPKRNYHLKAEANGMAVLTPELVRQIRALYATGDHTYSTVAATLSIGRTTVARVVTRQSWGHVE